jgi:uncharacterized membrane protein YdjX (TVP38/TMEM64 family)
MMLKNVSKLKILLILAAIILMLALRFSGVLDYFSLENLSLHREGLLQFVSNHYYLAVFIYLSLSILVVATTLPLAAFSMVLAGVLFGFKWGVLYANIGSTIGACISFFWLRYAFSQTVPGNLKIKLENFSKNIEAYGSFYFLSIHLMSLLPFFLINALAVLANISFFTFFWTTSLGIIPVSILYVYVGQKLGEINSIKEVLTWPIIFAFAFLAVLAILPVLISKIKKQ